MIIIKLIRYLMGTIKIKIYGKFPQRILNLCKNNNIAIWGITPHKNDYFAETYAKNYKQLKHLRRQTKVKLKVVRKNGLPFIIIKLKKCHGLIIGILTSIVLICFLTSRIWIIEIATENPIKKAQIEKELYGIGLKEGSKCKDINIKDTQRKLMLIDKDIAWVGINLKGSKANIEISLKQLPPPPISPKDRFADIVAEHDGQIVYMEIENGQPLFEVGNTVSKGDVIISGTMKDKHENIRLVYSRAKVIAECYEDIYVSVPFSKKVIIPAGNCFNKYTFFAFDKKLEIPTPLDLNEKIKINDSEKNLKYIPQIGIKTQRYIPIKYKTVVLTNEEAKLEAEILMRSKIKKIDNCQIIEEKMESYSNKDAFFIKTTLTVRKNIAKVREF